MLFKGAYHSDQGLNNGSFVSRAFFDHLYTGLVRSSDRNCIPVKKTKFVILFCLAAVFCFVINSIEKKIIM